VTIERFRPWLTLTFVAAVTAVFLLLWQSQVAAPSGAADSGFSQERAFETLTRLLKEQRPHVAGSPENAVVRDRILAELQSYGYEPEVQSVFQCAPPARYPGCTQVENVIAVHKGTQGGKAVLATAHYDSVPAGPGAGDDGAGTAVVLELARAFVGRETKNDVIFLITDGEETGLRGAYAFAEQHALMKDVGIVVNVEARGASGPSMMFETGVGSARLMDLFARTVAHPSANSLTYEVYKLLPNDTDFSVYRDRGLIGFNFAFSNSASLYHSRYDNLENLDRNSLQHHGDNAFALTFALADADLDALKSDRDASYFDLFGKVLVVWPASLNLPIALIALFGILALIVMHRSAFSWRSTTVAVVAVVLVPVLLSAVGWLLSFPLGVWPGVHPIDHPAPWAGRIALTAGAILVTVLVAGAVAPYAKVRAILLVNWLVLAALGVAVAIYVSGASFLLVWPAAGVALVGWIETFLRRTGPGRLGVTAVTGFVLAAFFWLPYVMALELVLGWNLSAFKILAFLAFAMALVPVLAASIGPASRRAWAPALVCAAVAAASAFVAAQTPAYAVNHPRGLNVVYYDDRSATPKWLIGFVGAPDETYLKAMGFSAKDEPYVQFGLQDAQGRLKPAADLHLAAPTLTFSDMAKVDGLDVWRGTLRGARGGLQLAIGIAPKSGIRSVRAEGQEVVNAARLAGGDPVFARILGVGERDLPVEIAFDAGAAPSVVVIERSPLPDGPEAQALVAARPPDAAPVHSGDAAIVVVKVALTPSRLP